MSSQCKPSFTPDPSQWQRHHAIQAEASCITPASSSCHQTCVFHLSTHFFAISLKLLRSSNEQGSVRRVHCIMCVVFTVSRPHSHVASPLKYPHFCLCSLLHVNPVRIRFRHLHVVHGLSNSLARLSLS